MSEARVTLITGASQGIGRELALAFAAVGDSLVLAARNSSNLIYFAVYDRHGYLDVFRQSRQ